MRRPTLLEAATPPKMERWWQVLGRIRRCETCGKDLRAITLARLDQIGAADETRLGKEQT